VCRLLKALYGLKRASRAWYKKLTAVLRSAGMRATEADPCLFFGTFGGILVFVLVYVDDLLVAGASDKAVDMCEHVLTGTFTVRDMGVPTHFLGIVGGCATTQYECIANAFHFSHYCVCRAHAGRIVRHETHCLGRAYLSAISG